MAQALRRRGRARRPGLVEALIDADVADGTVVRTASALRLTSHVVTLDRRSADVERLLGAVGGEHETTPPTVRDLEAAGYRSRRPRRRGAGRAGRPRLARARLRAGVVARAEAVVRAAGAAGITVSAFREALGTSRKYAVPLLEWFDRRGVTRRDGDLRFPRGA